MVKDKLDVLSLCDLFYFLTIYIQRENVSLCAYLFVASELCGWKLSRTPTFTFAPFFEMSSTP
jgi:hypothetical protein